MRQNLEVTYFAFKISDQYGLAGSSFLPYQEQTLFKKFNQIWSCQKFLTSIPRLNSQHHMYYNWLQTKKYQCTIVTDPGFPRGGGANSPGGGGRQHTILPNFPKNCMKLKEFGPRGEGGRTSKILLCRSTTVLDFDCYCYQVPDQIWSRRKFLTSVPRKSWY